MIVENKRSPTDSARRTTGNCARRSRSCPTSVVARCPLSVVVAVVAGCWHNDSSSTTTGVVSGDLYHRCIAHWDTFTSLMANDNSPAPFEWLAGGLFFGKGKQQQIESCRDVHVLLQGIDEDWKVLSTKEEAKETLEARLTRLRALLYEERKVTAEGRSRKCPHATQTLRGFTGESQHHDLLLDLVTHLPQLPFESRKHTAAIFNYMAVCGLEGSDAEIYVPVMHEFVQHVHSRFETWMTAMVQGHDLSVHNSTDVCLHYGHMYRACVRHAALYQPLVAAPADYVYPFLDNFVHVPNFEVSSDAMESVRAVLTASHAEIAADFLTREYDAIWEHRFNAKLLPTSANYMTRRTALQILSTVLLTRSNYNVMIRYVASRDNLVLAMNLLRDTSPHITLDAFHVFKVFVANPNKPPEIVELLKANQAKLCAYLTTLHKDKEEADPQFRDEKGLIVATIQGL